MENDSESRMMSRVRLARPVREQEILRIAASFQDEIGDAKLAEVRNEILIWAQHRVGGQLPDEAWHGHSFEHLSGGRTALAAALSASGSNLWSMRVDDPDKHIAGRVWTTEVTIGHRDSQKPKIGIRLIASTKERDLNIEPHVPGFMQQIIRISPLLAGSVELRKEHWNVSSEEEVDWLVSELVDPLRQRPYFVASGDERALDKTAALVDVNQLHRATIGLAHIAVVPAELTYALTRRLGRELSVYHGAVRTYMPGFDENSDPFEHRLFLSNSLESADGADRCVRSLRQLSARESILRCRLGHDVLTFGSVRTAALGAERTRQSDSGASAIDLLAATQKQNEALEEELRDARGWQQQFSELHKEAEDRAAAAEAQARGYRARVFFLQEQISRRGGNIDESIEFPESWEHFVEWCEKQLAGRLVLTPTARNGAKKPEFHDPVMAARCLVWLATVCRDRRISGGGSLSDYYVEDGIKNALCGGDSFEFSFQGQQIRADWHIKNGGNTRDPSRCLRIYYGWDDQSQQIVVADFPAHRVTDAS